ncbi:MAG: PD40 domain-containing protein [Chloroflexi bacterium]|nr:PD40 domain-containing protein [Chloroflexota bacterium]
MKPRELLEKSRELFDRFRNWLRQSRRRQLLAGGIASAVIAIVVGIPVYFVAAGGGGEKPPASITVRGTPTPQGTATPVALRLPADPVTPETPDLFVVNADGTGLTQIHSEFEGTVAWAPRGERLEFVTPPNGKATEVLIVSPAGDVERAVEVDGQVASGLEWSADGEWIAFVVHSGGRSDLHIISALGDAQRELELEGSPSLLAWSPRDDKLAFLLDPPFRSGAEQQIHIVDAVSESKDVAVPAAVFNWQGGIQWSPTGEWLTFSLIAGTGSLPQATVHVVKPDGSGRKQLAIGREGTRPLSWSPDGRKLLALAGDSPNYRIFTVLGVPSDNTLPLETGGGFLDPYTNVLTSWSPDGSKIAYLTNPFTPYCCSSLVLLDFAGPPRTVVESEGGVSGPVFSPDSKRLAYTIADLGGKAAPRTADNGTYVLDIASGAVTQVTRDVLETQPRWLPEGDLIAVDRGTLDPRYGTVLPQSLVVVPATGGEERTLCEAPAVSGTFAVFALSLTSRATNYACGAQGLQVGLVDGPEPVRVLEDDPGFRVSTVLWSPDGSQLVFVRSLGFGVRRYAVNVDGSDLTRLPGPRSPDGENVVFLKPSGEGQDELWVSDVDGGDERMLAEYVAEPIAWSPDSERIAFVSDGDLYSIAADGSGRSKLEAERYTQPLALTWSPDGERIAYLLPDALRVVDVASGDEKTLVSGVNFPTEFGEISPPAWSPEGDQLLFIAAEPQEMLPPPEEGEQMPPPLVDLWLIGADGRGLTRLTETDEGEGTPQDEGFPSWLPDGKAIAFWRTTAFNLKGLYLRDLDTGDETELATFNVDRGLGSPVFSPDGRQLAVFVGSVDDAGIRIINTDASGLGQLTRTGRDISLRHAEISWSANGQAVFFSSVLRPFIEEEFYGGKG